MSTLVKYYFLIGSGSALAVLLFLAVRYVQICVYVSRGKSKQTAAKGKDLLTILILSVGIVLLWLPLLLWYLFIKAKQVVKTSS